MRSGRHLGKHVKTRAGNELTNFQFKAELFFQFLDASPFNSEPLATMQLQVVLMRQAAEALESAEQARQDIIRVFKNDNATQQAHSAYTMLVETSHVYGLELSVAAPVAGLYAAHYSTEVHRASRVVTLLEKCHDAHRRTAVSLLKCHTPSGKASAESTKWRFGQAGNMLGLVRQGLLAVTALHDTAAMGSNSASGNNSTKFQGQAGQDVSPTDYFKPASLYDVPQFAQSLTRQLTGEELDSIFIETLDVAFARLTTTPRPRYANSHSNPFARTDMGYDSINSVIRSPMTKTLHAVPSQAYLEMALEIAKYLGNGYAGPMCLAKSMSLWNVNVGIIFSDDLSVIVWPVGKHHAKILYEVVIYCTRPVRGGYRFFAIQLLKPGVKAAPKSGNHEVQPRAREWSQRMRIVEANGDLYPLLSKSNSKPFSFLRLPTELRSKVYAYYLEYKNDNNCRWTLGPRADRISIPELSQTCHQLRDEVLPMFIESTLIKLVMTKESKSTSSSFVRSKILSDWNAPLARLSAFSNFTKVEIALPGTPYCQFRMWKTENRFASDFIGLCPSSKQRYPHPPTHPQVVARRKEFQRVVDIIVEDRRSEGLSLFDIAAIAEFLFKYSEAFPKYLK